MASKVTRLYEQFQPEHYDIELSIDKAALTFTGQLKLRGKKVGRPAKRLTLHQKDLKITKSEVVKHDRQGDTPVSISRVNNHKSYDELRLHSNSLIYPGNYTITMEFTGSITRPMNGIYPCFFTHSGKEKKLIATQFESHHAREAFPCIDEPEAKATFDLTLLTDDKETVISNTPVKNQLVKDGVLVTSFETTPKMSTYLLAFVIGEMKYMEAKASNGTVVRTYATPDNIVHTKFALEVAVKCLEFYNKYFDIPYPLAKCDFIALPDFAAGAMENWGCITFREQALLVDPANTSLHLKQFVADVIAHELTHMWFGDLVTMRWWTDLWLNESFATWMSWLAVDHLFPDWKVWTQFIVDEQGAALKLDALEHTHPIVVEVNHPDEIRTIFDAISYEKGASVLLMLHNYLGAKDFRDGLRLYLKRHAYGNTDTVDLWAALEEVSKKRVKEFMGKWTHQAGYPIVRADISDGQLSLSQERFYLNPKAKPEKIAKTWPVPLLPSQPLPKDMLEKSTQKLSTKKTAKPLVLNHERTGFYRVTYNPEHLQQLAEAIKTGELSELDRLGLLNDLVEASKAGHIDSVNVLKLLSAYENEDSTVVWDIIAGFIMSLRSVMDDDEVRAGLKQLTRALTAKQLKRLGWKEKPSDSHFDRLLRPTILGLSSWGEEPAVVKEALSRFKSMKKPEDIHPDLRGIVYGTAARTGGLSEFNKMMKMHDSSTNSEEKVTLAGSLTAFEQPALIKRALAKIDSDKVRLQDTPYWIAYSFSNRFAKRLTWEWMQTNWDWLIKNMGNDMSFYRMPLYASRGFSDESFLPEFKKFFNKHMSTSLERPVKQAIETIEWQAAWKKRDLDLIKRFLHSHLA